MACVDGNCPAENNEDPSACVCPPCPNSRLCGMHHIPSVYLEIHRGTCGNCAAIFGKALSFVEEEFDCPVCLESRPVGIRHPSNCSHIFCVDCTRRLFWASENDIDPEDYGFTGNSSLADWFETEGAQQYMLALEEDGDNFECDERCPLCRREAIPGWQTNIGEWAYRIFMTNDY